MSFHYWRNIGRPEKSEFLCLAGSYHGETVGALAVTDVAIFKDACLTSGWPKPANPRPMSPAGPPLHSRPISKPTAKTLLP